MPQTTEQKVREAVGVFDTPEKLDAAISELENTEFPRLDISVLGGTKEMEETFGRTTVKTEDLEDSPQAPRGISIRPEEKTIGACAIIGGGAYACGTIAAIEFGMDSTWNLIWAICIGSLIGAFIGGGIVFFLWKKFTQRFNQRIREGGLLLWVRTPGPDKEKTAKDIMRKHGGRHVHTHNIS